VTVAFGQKMSARIISTGNEIAIRTIVDFLMLFS